MCLNVYVAQRSTVCRVVCLFVHAIVALYACGSWLFKGCLSNVFFFACHKTEDKSLHLILLLILFLFFFWGQEKNLKTLVFFCMCRWYCKAYHLYDNKKHTHKKSKNKKKSKVFNHFFYIFKSKKRVIFFFFFQQLSQISVNNPLLCLFFLKLSTGSPKNNKWCKKKEKTKQRLKGPVNINAATKQHPTFLLIKKKLSQIQKKPWYHRSTCNAWI